MKGLRQHPTTQKPSHSEKIEGFDNVEAGDAVVTDLGIGARGGEAEAVVVREE